MRVLTAVIAAAAMLLVGLPAADASQADLDRARRRANEAAAELADAQSSLARLESETAALEAEKAAIEERVTTLQSSVRDLAISQFLRGSRSEVVVDLDIDVSRSTRANALARMVAAGNDDAVDQYQAAAEDLALASERLTEKHEEAGDAVITLRRRIDNANAEVAKLEKFEAERIAAEKAKRSQQASRPRSGGSRIVGSGSWICPVDGPRAFTNDWGDPRSGGRRHQGTDILSPRGTRVVAPVAGTVRGHNSRLGGISFYLNGVDGVTYFGTHLNSLSGASGRVEAGTVLGYVGNTGNARGGPTHLHFEIHPGGGGAVNPYPTLRAYC